MQFLIQAWRQAPVSLSLILISILVTAALEYLASNLVFWWLAFTPLGFFEGQILSQSPSANFESLQIWRFFSPIFMHFSLMHLVFNCLWIWILGQQLERVFTRRYVLFLALLVALVSNSAQFYSQHSSQFGGLSGVVYGYLGYVWLKQRLQPNLGLDLHPNLAYFMLAWLALGFTNISSLVGINIANMAHLGGLLTGLGLAVLPGQVRRRLG